MAKKTNKTSHVLNLITNGGSGDSGAEQEELKEVPEKKESEQEIKGEDAPEKEASLPAADKEMPVKVVSSGEKRVIVVDESSQNQKIENQILDNLTNHLEEEEKAEEKQNQPEEMAEEKQAQLEEKAEEKQAQPEETAAEKAEEKPKRASTKKSDTTKKPARAASTKKADADKVEEIYVQFNGQEITTKDILEKVKQAHKDNGHRIGHIKSTQIYIKPEDGMAYYVINGKYKGEIPLSE